jgi:DNA-directed RNA polymerase subunit RPC12/RpoP
MLTYYCPHCWQIVTEEQKTCPHCGYVLDKFKNYVYEDKLLAALHHSVPERRIMAAQILGIRECIQALPEFGRIIASDETNYFFLRAILLATSKIVHPEREAILLKATRHPSQLVSRLAKELLQGLHQDHIPDKWDRHTG